MCVKIGVSWLEERRGALFWWRGQNLVKAGVDVGNPCVENADKSQDLKKKILFCCLKMLLFTHDIIFYIYIYLYFIFVIF